MHYTAWASPIFSVDYNSGLAGYKPIIIYINKYDEICEIYCYGWWEPPSGYVCVCTWDYWAA